MKVVFANSAWVSVLERLVLAGGRFSAVRLKVRYGVVIHPETGPILIDTGYTAHSVEGPNRSWMLRLYSYILSPQLDPDQQPETVLDSFGYTPEDVKLVITTHFHADHVSGLSMFPNAKFVVDERVWNSIKTRASWKNLSRGIFTELLPTGFEQRCVGLTSFPVVTTLNGAQEGYDILGDGSLIGIELPGHAEGHFGVVINAEPNPLIYAADVQWLREAALLDKTPGFPACLVAENFSQLKLSSQIIRDHIAAGYEVVFCHDPEVMKRDLPKSDTHP